MCVGLQRAEQTLHQNPAQRLRRCRLHDQSQESGETRHTSIRLIKFYQVNLNNGIKISQIWVGCHGRSAAGKARGKIYVVNTDRYTVEKELVAHADSVQTLCSAEDRYVLSGAAQDDGKIGIWKVE